MAIRNPWVLPAAALVMLAVMGAVFFGSGAIEGGSPPQQAPNFLHVPGNYGTIQAAIDAAKTGDTVVVAAGTYNEDLLLNKSISLIAASFDPANAANNTVILDGGKGQAAILVPNGVTPMPVVRGFVVRNGNDGIEAHSQLDAENDYFYGSQMLIEYMTGGGGINRNNVYFNSANDALHIDDLSAPLLVQGNRFMYAGDDAIEVDLQAASTAAPPLEMDIWDNILIGSSQDGIKIVDYAANPHATNRRINIAGNLIANNRRAGIGFMHSGNTNEDYSGIGTAEAVRVFNDTLYGNNYGLSGGANLVAFNDIIANSAARGAWKVQGPPSGSSVVAYTLFFNNAVDMDQTQAGTGDILGQDPLFVGAPSPGPDGSWGTVDDDFSGLVLRPGSPAVDRGVTQYTTSTGELIPPTPLTGYTGAAPDLGWRELGSSGFLTPVPGITAAPLLPTSTPQATGTLTTTPAATVTVTPATGTPATGTPQTTITPGSQFATGTPGATSTPAVTGSPMLIIQSASPSTVQANAVVTLVITGAGFQPGTTVTFEGLDEAAPQVTSVEFDNPTTMKVNVSAIDDMKGIDVWNIRLTNPDGTTAILRGGLTILP